MPQYVTEEPISYNKSNQSVSYVAAARSVAPMAGRDQSPSKIRDFITTIEGQIEGIYGTIGSLEDRLSTTLTPLGPESGDCAKTGNPQAAQSSVADRLQSITYGLSLIGRRITAITDRVEV